MAIPKYFEFFPTVIECLSDATLHTSKEIREYCISAFKLTKDDCLEQLESGQLVVNTRISWACTYLKKAGLIDRPQRGSYLLTILGKAALKDGVDNITLDYLKQFEAFRDFVHVEPGIQSSGNTPLAPKSDDKSPEELIEYAMNQLNSSLADALLIEVMKMTPYEFEKLVVKLLIKIGYGSAELSLNSVTKLSGDEGVDGMVAADRLGFDVIYTQAKQWKPDSVVGRPEIQKFLGALAGQGVAKGIFITTAKFSSEAREYVAKQLLQKIVLIDGKRLMELMIEYNLGVSVENLYTVKKLDTDFFTED